MSESMGDFWIRKHAEWKRDGGECPMCAHSPDAPPEHIAFIARRFVEQNRGVNESSQIAALIALLKQEKHVVPRVVGTCDLVSRPHSANGCGRAWRPFCKCGHSFFYHSIEHDTACLVDDCDCQNYRVEVAPTASGPTLKRTPDLVIQRMRDWNYGAFLNETDASCIAIGATEEEARNNGMRELLKRGDAMSILHRLHTLLDFEEGFPERNAAIAIEDASAINAVFKDAFALIEQVRS